MNEAKVTVSVTLPQALLFEARLSQEAASEALLQAFVLSLYRQDRISTGKAAQRLGLHRMAFTRLLTQENITFLNYTKGYIKVGSATQLVISRPKARNPWSLSLKTP